MFNNVVTPNQMANNIGMLAKAVVEETEDSMMWSQQPVTSEEDSTEPYDCIRISSVRNEVFTTLDVICPRNKGHTQDQTQRRYWSCGEYTPT